MAFIPINFSEGRFISMPTATGVTTAIGEAAKDNGAGFLTNATANQQTDISYIFWEITTTAADGDLVLCYKVDESVRIKADVDAAAAQTDVHTFCDIATSTTLNPNASDDDIFYIESIDLTDGKVGTSKKVHGYFVNGTPNS